MCLHWWFHWPVRVQPLSRSSVAPLAHLVILLTRISHIWFFKTLAFTLIRPPVKKFFHFLWVFLELSRDCTILTLVFKLSVTISERLKLSDCLLWYSGGLLVGVVIGIRGQWRKVSSVMSGACYSTLAAFCFSPFLTTLSEISGYDPLAHLPLCSGFLCMLILSSRWPEGLQWHPIHQFHTICGLSNIIQLSTTLALGLCLLEATLWIS